ncbi:MULTISPECIES: tRNA lysidine(34) synthetase TilS [Lysobacter]|uniref:tRNA lysidine(34) synthetase TilS n=2 Tax=Lysobacteraceae TaxID=32033 RepID=UPI001CD0BE06|nr:MULTISPECIES: tRNA lysidine(34) synthetase TilS [Lysobacter]
MQTFHRHYPVTVTASWHHLSMHTPRPLPDQTFLGQAFHDRPRARLLVGFSGGLDSTVLLHALASDPAVRTSGLRAIHIHHGLHANADRWAAHCENVCSALGIAFDTVPVTVQPDGNGTEAAARDARHAAFASKLEPGDVLTLAHHRDDQAETFLLRALRGSGVDGLSAMRRWRDFGAGRLWRPLLDIPRAALLAYANAHGLRWIEDPSNTDSRFDRNFLRQQVLPLLRARWPQADAAFARSATLCDEASQLLDAEDAAALASSAGHHPRVLSRAALLALPAPRRARVLRRWTTGLGLPPLPAHGLARIESDLLRARADASARFEWSGAVIHAWRDDLHAAPVQAGLPDGWRTSWDGSRPLPLPNGGELVLEGAPALPNPCRVTARRGGERITLPGRTHSHALKHVLQELGVPPWQRPGLPLLSAPDGKLLAVADLAYEGEFADWLERQGAHLRWHPASD